MNGAENVLLKGYLLETHTSCKNKEGSLTLCYKQCQVISHIGFNLYIWLLSGGCESVYVLSFRVQHIKEIPKINKLWRKFFIILLGRETLFVLAPLGRVMAEKRDKPFSQLRGGVNSRIKIRFARSYSCIICRAWLPSPLYERKPDWDLESGIRLAG